MSVQDKIDRALHDAGFIDGWRIRSSRVQRFNLENGRDGEPCELVIVPARCWAHWRHIKAARKGGAAAAAQWQRQQGGNAA